MTIECHKKESFMSRHGDLLMLMFTTISLFLWSRSESKEDTRRIESLVASIHSEVYQEMKDFHGRLCTIEERNKGK